MVDSSSVIIKGIKDGLLVALGEGEWSGIQNALFDSLEQKASFFQGARMAMEVGNRQFHLAELIRLRDELSERGISLWAVVGSNLETEQAAKGLGLATKLSSPRTEHAVRLVDTTFEDEGGVFIHKTLRSGFRLVS